MSFKRETIVAVGAIVGGGLLAFSLQPLPAQSSSCLQWASEGLSAAAQNVQYAVSPPPLNQGYYDVRYHRNIVIYATPTTNAAQAAPASASNLLPSGMTEAEYQAKRHALQGGGY